jgi:uracil-DNA glycosylase
LAKGYLYQKAEKWAQTGNDVSMADVRLHPSWKAVLGEEFAKPYFEDLISFVKQEYTTNRVYPPGNRIFSALDHTPFESVKVVILGQDPYHGPGQANGLCFSVNEGIAIPPSLRNIFSEIKSDLNIAIPENGNLERWADQGVLLLNATLTVRAHQAGSHQNKGWETFTDAVINALSTEREGLVFMLWGGYARKKGAIINTGKHFVLSAPHPSPLSAHRGFLGCRHFSKCNRFLAKNGKEEIKW